MSSTNRSDARDSHISDYYVTPQKPIRQFLEKFCSDYRVDLSGKRILDPCAGGDQKNAMSYPACMVALGVDPNSIVTNDIREDSPATNKIDFLQNRLGGGYDIVITNPPFAIAQDIIERSLEECNEGGYVIMLLRLNYFGGKVRQEFRKRNFPMAVYVHNRRMSFTDDGKTDSVEYMHAVRKKGYKFTSANISIIYDYM